MSRYQHHSRNERSHPHSHSHSHSCHESSREGTQKKKVTTKNLAATLGMMGLAIGATLLVEGGPWKSRMAAAATVVGMEQLLERGGFFDGERDGRVGMEDKYRRGRRDREERGDRYARDVSGTENERRRRGVVYDVDDDNESRYRDRRERDREMDSRRETRGTGHGYDGHERSRRHTHDDERRHRERRARREANRRFDEEYEIEEVPV